jgi:hypothetical protein
MKINFVFILAIFFASCGNENKKEDASTPEEKPALNEMTIASVENKKSLNDLYCGQFVAAVVNNNKVFTPSNKISVMIDSINNGVIKGRSVVAGNSRPFEGACVDQEGRIKCSVKEPGDDKYDGSFEFVIVKDSGIVRGRWIANNKKLAVSERTFSLTKTAFTYDENSALPASLVEEELYNSNYEGYEFEKITADAVKFNASTQELKKEDIENMYKGDLEIIRNAIYARHGYSFKDKRMRFVFDAFVDWYIPVATDVRDAITDLELKNINLIKRYEKHADNYYDTYGR